MERKAIPITYQVNSQAGVYDPQKAYQEQIKSGKFRYLLAHALDGIIWGLVEQSNINYSIFDGSPSPEFRWETLQQIRLFGVKDEFFMWRNSSGWQSRHIQEDAQGYSGHALTESWTLWGTDPVKTYGQFTLVREADLGIRQAFPLPYTDRRDFYLMVRHYLQYNSEGSAYVHISRLVDLHNGGEK
jgi:CRISPR-associated protein (TIGR03984 family)